MYRIIQGDVISNKWSWKHKARKVSLTYAERMLEEFKRNYIGQGYIVKVSSDKTALTIYDDHNKQVSVIKIKEYKNNGQISFNL